MKRWPHQEKALDSVKECIANKENPLIIMATGTGKTRVLADTAAFMKAEGVLAIAHRGLLLDQMENAFMSWANLPSDREQAEKWADWASPVITATPGTLAGDRLMYKPKNRGLIMVDEAHRAVTPQMMKIYEHFNWPTRMGCTATGDRADGRPLTPVFSKIAYQYSLDKAIRDGYLCNIIGRRVRSFEIDLSGLHKMGTDFIEAEVAEVIEKDLTTIAHNIIKETKDRKKVLLFMPNVASSKHLAEILSEMGETADYVAGKKENGMAFAKFHSGELKYLASCRLLTEGYDEPGIDTIVMLYPTLSRTLYSQAVGRGTRIHPDKDELLLLEFTYNSNRHKLVSAFELVGDDMSERVVERAESLAGTEDIDFLAALEDSRVLQYDYRAIVNRAIPQDHSFEYFNPLDIGDLVSLDLDKESEVWFNGSRLAGDATDGQRELLKRYMIEGGGLSKSQASSLITKLLAVSKPGFGYASTAQMRALSRLYPKMSFPFVPTKAAASMLIGTAQRNKS